LYFKIKGLSENPIAIIHRHLTPALRQLIGPLYIGAVGNKD
jgi:hypothetical protein